MRDAQQAIQVIPLSDIDIRSDIYKDDEKEESELSDRSLRLTSYH